MRLSHTTALAGIGFAAWTGAFLAGEAGAQTPAPQTVSFHRQVRPLLEKRCSGCHGPANRGGKLSVTTYAAVKSGGVAGAGFVSGKPEDSPLYKLISGKKPKMPLGAPPLPAKEVETIRLWIAQGGKDDTPVANDPISPERPPVYSTLPVTSALAYSPDGETLAVSGYREVLLHKSDGSGLVGRLVGRSQRIESVAWSPDGKYLAAVGGSPARFGELQIWDVAAKKQLKSVEVGFDLLYGVSFSPDGKMVAFGGAEKSAHIYTVPEAQPVLKFDNHSDWVSGTTFSKDSKNMVSVSRDKSLKLVEIATKNFVDDINYQVYGGGYLSVFRNPMTDEVAAAGEEGIIRYYSIYKKAARNVSRDDFNLVRTFEKIEGRINAVAFNTDGTLLAAGGEASEVRVYKTADGTRVATLKGHVGSVHSLSWHPKKPELAVGGFDGTVRLYKVPSGELVKSFVPAPVSPRVAQSK